LKQKINQLELHISEIERDKTSFKALYLESKAQTEALKNRMMNTAEIPGEHLVRVKEKYFSRFIYSSISRLQEEERMNQMKIIIKILLLEMKMSKLFT